MSLRRQSPGKIKMSNYSPATMTSLRIEHFLSKDGVAPQAVRRRDGNVKLFARDSAVTGYRQCSGDRASLLRQSPRGTKMSNFSPATVTSLGIAKFLGQR